MPLYVTKIAFNVLLPSTNYYRSNRRAVLFLPAIRGVVPNHLIRDFFSFGQLRFVCNRRWTTADATECVYAYPRLKHAAADKAIAHYSPLGARARLKLPLR